MTRVENDKTLLEINYLCKVLFLMISIDNNFIFPIVLRKIMVIGQSSKEK